MKITCTNCQKALSIDETKLPMREVSFPCPVCKAKLTVDRRELEGQASAPAAAPAPALSAQHAHAQDDDDHANEFGEKALIVGKDDPLLRQASKLIGYLPVVHADAAAAREYYMQEFPHVVFLYPQQLTAPPLEALAPIISLAPIDRRKSFFILIADNLRTFDGNAAFLYGVNLVVASKDLGQFSEIYREAHNAHERMYASVNAVMREKQLA
ncbi:MAG TPA: zinc-ribbon domain-containing protein [Thermoanaerobaculia bacterium]|nr:zinc-ribbon domain-containing protein [Thermoanaerobaculia bacterium]